MTMARVIIMGIFGITVKGHNNNDNDNDDDDDEEDDGDDGKRK